MRAVLFPSAISECLNGGVDSAPDTCDCSGTGYEGDQCQIGVFLKLYIVFGDMY